MQGKGKKKREVDRAKEYKKERETKKKGMKGGGKKSTWHPGYMVTTQHENSLQIYCKPFISYKVNMKMHHQK